MKLISLMHENLLLSSNLKDFYERTSGYSSESLWINQLLKRLKAYPSPHSEQMIKEIQSLTINKNSAKISFDDFYGNFPHLYHRYDYVDNANLLEDGYIYSRVKLNFFNDEYIFKYKVSDEIEFSTSGYSDSRLLQKELLFKNNKIKYKLDIFNGKNKHLSTITQTLFSSPSVINFIENVEDILELDMIVLSNFIEKNPAIKHYLELREIIPKILTRCHKDSLFYPVSEESVKVYEVLCTQKHIFKLDPKIKFNQIYKNN